MGVWEVRKYHKTRNEKGAERKRSKRLERERRLLYEKGEHEIFVSEVSDRVSGGGGGGAEHRRGMRERVAEGIVGLRKLKRQRFLQAHA